MAPLTVDIPHSLGKAAAKARIAGRIGELDRHLPGKASVRAHWAGEYRLEIHVGAMGQEASVGVEIEEARVRVTMLLPPLLAMFGRAIEAAVRAKGGKLLLGDDR
jgi:Putative polyhydroxyalkanoic acid system protein (PHA_gran_rgn)